MHTNLFLERHCRDLPRLDGLMKSWYGSQSVDESNFHSNFQKWHLLSSMVMNLDILNDEFEVTACRNCAKPQQDMVRLVVSTH